ncbi:MAG: sensor histidine kinase [Pseudomonadota bacterium]
MHKLWALFVLVYLLAGGALAQGIVPASEPALPTSPSRSTVPFLLPQAEGQDSLAARVGVLRDATQALTLAQARALYDERLFKRLERRSIDEGYTRDHIWLRMAVTNGTAPGGPSDWRLHFRENFLQVLDVWQVPPGAPPRLLLSHRPDSPFSARTIAYPELVVALDIPPGETHEVFVRYASGGSSQLYFSFRTAESFADLVVRKTAKNFIYYGMLLLLVIIGAAAFLATRRGVFGAYALYVCFGLLFIMHNDGNTFRYLWPNAPLFNGFASVVLGAGIIASGANFARAFLGTALHHPWLDRLMLGLIALPVLMMASTLVIDTQEIKRALVALSLVSVLAFTGAGIVAARTRFREVRFYLIAWSGAVISAAIMSSRHILGLEISEELQFDSMRIVFVTDAALMGLAILDRINQLRRARAQALEMSLFTAERNLTLNQRLQGLENQVRVAHRLARARDRHIADTVHDLRQPLQALRLNIRALADNPGPGDAAAQGRIEDMFRYLETLVVAQLEDPADEIAADEMAADEIADGRALAQGRAVADGRAGVQASRDTPRPELTDLGEVLGAVAQMFGPEAAEKGLALRVVPSGAQVALPPLDVMRLATNLVSNAVKYTPAGAVLLGVRRRGGVPWLEVHDTGIGIAPEARAAALDRHGRLRQGERLADGQGLGLSIVAEIATRHGLTLDLATRPGGGTCVAVSLAVPIAPAAAAGPERMVGA